MLGMGLTGMSCARYLRSRQRSFSAFDAAMGEERAADFQREYPDVPLHLGEFDADVLSACGTLMVSPGISLEQPAIEQALQAGSQLLSDIDVLVGEIQVPVLAITGSNGKTTVTTLVGAMAQAAGFKPAVGGNIGTPVLDLLDDDNDYDLWVLEVSSFQLERSAPLGAQVATVLNLSPDHMDRHGDLISYQQAKQRIYRGARYVVANRSDKLTWPLLTTEQTSISFGLDQPDLNQYGVRVVEGESWLARGNEPLLPVSALKIHGDHNVLNALAALAMGEAAGFARPVMLEVLQTFPGLPHRCQWVGEHGGVEFFNDSKGTNTGATLAAVAGLSRRDGDIILIAGGQAKGADFNALQAIAPCLKGLVLIGEAAEEIAEVFKGTVVTRLVDDMASAVAVAMETAAAGDRILLSPACASFDMFEGYAQRGEIFCAEVHRLQGGDHGA